MLFELLCWIFGGHRYKGDECIWSRCSYIDFDRIDRQLADRSLSYLVEAVRKEDKK